jgi:hypothetical protein
MTRKKKRDRDNIITGEIVHSPERDGQDYDVDLRSMSAEELREHAQRLRVQLARRQLTLADLQILEAQGNVVQNAREIEINRYVEEITALDARTAGGLRSVRPEPGDDPDLVAEAWRRFVAGQRGGGSRFG